MKYIENIKFIFTYIKNSFISLLSLIIIKLIPKKKISKLVNSLKNKKVLILGSGPSLDKLNQDIIDRYETIFFLNNSINVSKVFNFKKKEKIFFNSDLFRFKHLKNEIYNLDKTWTHVFIPIHLQLFFSFISFYFNKNVFMILPKYRLGTPFEKNVTKSLITYFHHKSHNISILKDINNFKVFPYTVALNAFYFLIFCKVNQIHYLGCDFSTGRSIFTNDKGISVFSNNKINLWVNKLKKLSKNYSIDFKDLK